MAEKAPRRSRTKAPGTGVSSRRSASKALPAVDVTRAASRIRAVEWALTQGARKADLTGEIATLQSDIGRRRAELAADEGLLARLFAELEAIEKCDAARASAFGPGASPIITLQQAAGILGCNEATAKKYGEMHGFGWFRDGRWYFSRAEVIAYLCGLPVERIV